MNKYFLTLKIQYGWFKKQGLLIELKFTMIYYTLNNNGELTCLNVMVGSKARNNTIFGMIITHEFRIWQKRMVGFVSKGCTIVF